MKVSSTVKMNFGRINQLTEAAVTALEKTAEALHTEVIQAQVMPFDTGALQGEKTFVDYTDAANGKVSIVSNGPYARRLYYHPEYDYKKASNPNAGGQWYKDWLPGGKNADFARKTFKELYKQLGGV